MPSKAPRMKTSRIARVHSAPEIQVTYGKGRGGRPWRRLRAEVLKRDGYLCQCDDCKASNALLIATQVDHIVPRYKGGTDSLTNLRAINAACHSLKTQREAQEARRYPRGEGEK